jgi:mRNA interferase HicA
VKRAELIRRITELGAVFVREGGEHTIYLNPFTKLAFSVPRHNEVDKYTARGIIKDAARR